MQIVNPLSHDWLIEQLSNNQGKEHVRASIILEMDVNILVLALLHLFHR